MSVHGDIGNDRDRLPCTYDGERGCLTRGLHKNCNRNGYHRKRARNRAPNATSNDNQIIYCVYLQYMLTCSCDTFTAGDLWGKTWSTTGGREGEGDING